MTTGSVRGYEKLWTPLREKHGGWSAEPASPSAPELPSSPGMQQRFQPAQTDRIGRAQAGQNCERVERRGSRASARARRRNGESESRRETSKRTLLRVFQSMRLRASAAIDASSFGIVCAPERSSMNCKTGSSVSSECETR